MDATRSWSWRARQADGGTRQGTMSAESPAEVSRRLREDGLVVLSIEEGAKAARAAELDVEQIRRNEAVKRIPRDEVIGFCEQLSVMLETGVPLSEALDAFIEQGASREFTYVLQRLRDEVFSGATFSEAAGRWPKVFPRIMISLLRASEASGTMALMLGRVADYLGRERRTLRQVRGALTYPAFMTLAGLSLSAFLMVFILPRFAGIYEGRSAELPLITEILLTASRAVTGHWMTWGPVAAAMLVGGVLGSRTEPGRAWLDWLRLNVPLLGTLYRRLYLARATRTMATLLKGGVHLLDVISICRDVTANVHFDALWTEMEDGVRQGKLVSAAICDSPYVPSSVASMIASGERSGRLHHVMERIAEFNEQELEASIKEVTGYIEPVMIVVMGLIVGGVAIALLLPIFQMGSVVSS